MRQAAMLMAVVHLACASMAGCDDNDLTTAEAVDELQVAPLEPEPGDLPQTTAQRDRVELGRLLFWDPILSGDLDVACATCHHPDHGYADGIALSRGVGAVGLGPNRVGGERVDRNAPTVLNTGLFGQMGPPGQGPPQGDRDMPMFWDSRANGLEEQALMPIESDVEMRGTTIAEDAILDEVVGRVAAMPEYRALFAAAFGDDGVTAERIAGAIAAFERSLVALDAPFDAFLRGDPDALTPQEQRGMQRFAEVGCGDCHSGPLLSDFETHGIGIVSRTSTGAFDDGAGDGEFRTPPLRNLTLTAPYMHDGSLATLRDVLEHYDRISGGGGGGGGGGNNGPGGPTGGDGADNDGPFPIDRDARRLRINRGDFDDIEAFLRSLTATTFDRTIPAEVPSGLQVGGEL